MKQLFDLNMTFWPVVAFVALITCQVQGGIITNQESLSDSLTGETSNLTSSSTSTTSTSSSITSNNAKNSTKTGRVIYTASYSNVRITAKEPKPADKFYPAPAPVPKKSVMPAANIVPVGPTFKAPASTTTEEAPTTTTTTIRPTDPPSTTTTTTTTTETPSVQVKEVETNVPGMLESVEETEQVMMKDPEVFTETNSEPVNDNSEDDTDKNVTEDDSTATEPTTDYKLLEVAAG